VLDQAGNVPFPIAVCLIGSPADAELDTRLTAVGRRGAPAWLILVAGLAVGLGVGMLVGFPLVLLGSVLATGGRRRPAPQAEDGTTTGQDEVASSASP
jgi:hypothetical protein